MQPQHVGAASVTWAVGPWASLLTGCQSRGRLRVSGQRHVLFYFTLFCHFILFILPYDVFSLRYKLHVVRNTNPKLPPPGFLHPCSPRQAGCAADCAGVGAGLGGSPEALAGPFPSYRRRHSGGGVGGWARHPDPG